MAQIRQAFYAPKGTPDTKERPRKALSFIELNYTNNPNGKILCARLHYSRPFFPFFQKTHAARWKISLISISRYESGTGPLPAIQGYGLGAADAPPLAPDTLKQRLKNRPLSPGFPCAEQLFSGLLKG